MIPLFRVGRTYRLATITTSGGLTARLLPVPLVVIAPVSILVPPLGAGAQLYSPVVGSGAVLVSPLLRASTATGSAPSVTAGVVSIAPTMLGSSADMAPPALTVGAVQVAPALTGSTATGFPLAVQPGFAAIAPAALTSGAALLSPTVIGAGATTIIPAVTPSTVSGFGPVVQPGAVSVAPPPPASSASFMPPIVGVGAATVAPALVASTAAAFGPVVATGTVAIAPPALASTVNASPPTISSGEATISPPIAASSAAGFPAVVGSGAVTVAPTAPSSSATAFAPILASGPVTIAPPIAASSSAIFPPIASVGDVTIAPPSGASQAAGFAPTVQAEATAPAPAVSSINADGWSAQWANEATLPVYSQGDTEFAPDTSPVTMQVTRTGYDAAGTLRSDIAGTLIVTRRIRKPWTDGTNDHLTGNGNRVALSGYVLASDVLPAGVTNNSNETSPKPVAQFADRNRRVIGNSGYSQIRAYHWAARNGKPVAAIRVWYRSTDGSKTTEKVLAAGPKVLGGGGNDRFAVIGYDATVNTAQWSDGSAIPDGTVLIRECEVMPWVGSDIRTTVGGTIDGRGFTPQTFYKHAARAANPVYAIVNPTSGTDETVSTAGVGATSGTQKVSTNRATAKANAFANIHIAVQALRASTTLTGGFTDGCIVQLAAGTYSTYTNTTSATYQTAAEIIIETDTDAAPYSAVLSGTYSAFRQTFLTFRKVKFARTTTTAIPTNAAGRTALVDCQIDNGSYTTTPFATGGPNYIDGLTMLNVAALATAGGGFCGLMRGVQMGTSKGTRQTIDAHNMCGCLFYNVALNTVSRDNSNSIADSFANLGRLGSSGMPSLNANETVDGMAFVNYIVEFADTSTSNPSFSPSADGASQNLLHLINWYGTYAGASIYGRWNYGYDETTGTLRSHRHHSQIGMVPVAMYSKHDWFLGATAAAGSAARSEAPQHVGGWSVLYQVNSRGMFHQFPTFAGQGPNNGPNGSENPAFFGLKAKYLVNGTSATIRNDPLFAGGNKKATDYDGTTVSGGTGGTAADYVPASGSPLIGVLSAAEEALSFDIIGNPRNRGTLGAYA